MEQEVNTEHAANPDAIALADKAIASLTLAIELFNRPTDIARPEAVLILLHHSFELILKSLIVDHTGTAIDEERGYSYAFDTCLRLAEEELDLINRDQRRFLSMLDNLRDSAVHYYQVISEDMLYVFAQGSVTLFDFLIRQTGRGTLAELLPARVLPISAHPPKDLEMLIDAEFRNVTQLVRQADMSHEAAIARLRPLMAFSVGGEEQHRRMKTEELESAIERLKVEDDWRVVFPQIAKLEFSTEGDGIPIRFKVVKDCPDALPVRILRPGDPVPPGGYILQREINIFDKFNMGLRQLAENLGISGPRALAMVREFDLQDDIEAFRRVTIGSQTYNRYSKKALDFLRERLASVEEVWSKHRVTMTRRKKK